MAVMVIKMVYMLSIKLKNKCSLNLFKSEIVNLYIIILS